MSTFKLNLRTLFALGSCVWLMGINQCPTFPPVEPDPPDDTPVTCEVFCELEADMAYESCMERGGDERTCTQIAEETFAECYRPCSDEVPEEPTPPEPTRPPAPDDDLPCDAQCDAEAHALYEECVAATGDQDACVERAQAYFAQCVDSQCVPPDVPPPDEPPSDECEDQCAMYARGVHDACLSSGLDPEWCEEQAYEAQHSCMREQCVDVPDEPPPPSCDEACHERFEGALNSCLEEGGDPERCHMHAEAVFEECLQAACDNDPPDEDPPADACTERCENHARQVFEECVDSGNEPGRCEVLAQSAFDECLAATTCLADDEPPPDDSCENACGERARSLYRSCIDDGGSPERCEAQAAEAFDACVDAHCG